MACYFNKFTFSLLIAYNHTKQSYKYISVLYCIVLYLFHFPQIHYKVRDRMDIEIVKYLKSIQGHKVVVK